jgi:membrane peptidoglycan carboxypeptidase
VARSSRPHPAATLAKLIGLLGLVGVLCAGALFPYVGGLGLVAKNESAKFLDQGCNLTPTPPPLKTTLYARDGKTVIASIFTQDRRPIPLAQMPKVLQQALVATEDRRFYKHQGVDMRGLLRSALQTTSGDTQGGSTLTMQYVKQERYYQATGDPAAQAAAVDQNITRKIEDAKCAIDIEKRESKQQILESYLNIAFFGENSYGIETAAETYFGKHTSQLDLAESATLVGVLRAPAEFDPFNDRKRSQARRDLVIQNLVDQGYITAAAGKTAQAEPIKLATTAPPELRQGCAGANGALHNVQFFCDYAVNWMLNNKAVTLKTLSEGGLNIVTTLDPTLQNTTQDSLSAQLPATSPTTAVMPQVDPRTGDVLAMATSKKYGGPTSASDNTHTMLPLFTEPTTGGASTYKLFTMLAALNAGATPNLTLGNNDIGSNYAKYKTRTCSGGNFLAQNSSEQTFNRNETLASAIAKSSNTYFVALEDEFFSQCDLKPAVQMAISLGMNALNDSDSGSGTKTLAQVIEAQSRATFTLGQVGTSPLELTGAYAAVANDGVFCAPAPVKSIVDPSGKAIAVPRKPCARVLSQQVARTAAQLLVPDTRNAIGTSSASFQSYYGQGGSDIAGKTGTNNATDSKGNDNGKSSSLWFVGITPDLAATTALINFARPSSTISGLPNVPDGTPIFGAYAAQMWANALSPVLLAGPRWAWPDPAAVDNAQQVPSVLGQDLATATTTLTSLGFKVAPYANGQPYCGSAQPYSTVGYQQPAFAPPGSTITLCLSNGLAPFVWTPPTPVTRPIPRQAQPPANPQPSANPQPNPVPVPLPPLPTIPRRSRGR